MEFYTFQELKLDEFFAYYLTDPAKRGIFQAISSAARDLEAGKRADFDFSVFDAPSQLQSKRPPSITASVTRMPIVDERIDTKIKKDDQIILAGEKIPTFYGAKENAKEVSNLNEYAKLDKVPADKLGALIQAYCKLPRCFAPLLLRTRDIGTGEKLKAFWEKYLLNKDPNERFFRLIVGDERNFIFPSDLTPFVRVIVETHASLQFLKEEALFQEKFIDFIVTRCFYAMDSDLRGTIGVQQFRKMDLAQIFYKAERMQDVNDSQHIFNYQHFYVAFCKFWDLDGDSDGFISKDDLLKFNDSAISPVIIERFFKSTAYPRSTNRKKEIDFTSFAYFLMSSEDKTNLTSINFWYRLCDLDDDGLLSIKEIEDLYHTQYERMRITGNETIPFEDIFRQLIDMINPEGAAYVTVQDLLKSKMADVFFNTLFDLQKFLIREYQFPLVNAELDEMTKKLSPWEVYVLIEYDQLVNDGA
ncbi:phosphoprotein phosphatase [Tritrichomonas foetus]|uniref:Phosphoprotein phosphatase n=1 Tax=Tritrichomonas foetus TaxID=1144522 RepID=A0A1J4KRV8_9EUKA|nr:phosphoprotein phosphatase [Tritrichomonas foetus]|eukprot:OHT14025.1 phosphoprotein phosphatase [Tritrichomonas foetus]